MTTASVNHFTRKYRGRGNTRRQFFNYVAFYRKFSVCRVTGGQIITVGPPRRVRIEHRELSTTQVNGTSSHLVPLEVEVGDDQAKIRGECFWLCSCSTVPRKSRQAEVSRGHLPSEAYRGSGARPASPVSFDAAQRRLQARGQVQDTCSGRASH